MTVTLAENLRRELDGLRCHGLRITPVPRTRAAQTDVVLQLAGAHGTPSIADIASEGEHRAVALAFFLAEVGMSGGDGGIVVDDPVSSLDDERRNYIAERLVRECTDRQVIVFTHDLPFMLDLVDQADKAGVQSKMLGLWRSGEQVGRVDGQPPFKAMRLRQRVGQLQTTVQEWESGDQPRNQDEAWRRVEDFYARMRTTWERAVEERLFGEVVVRLQRSVQTNRFRNVRFTEDLAGVVEQGMTRCSFFVHDEPARSASSLPGRSDLAADLRALDDFEKSTRPS